MISRRNFFGTALAGATAMGFGKRAWAYRSTDASQFSGVSITTIELGEEVFRYIQRVNGSFDPTLYMQILGAANEFKEGDQIVGVAAADETSRANARTLLANTCVRDLDAHPLLEASTK